jgi:N-acyl-D-amino-acid deacylase
VAVLDFENKTGDPELEHWRRGIEGLLSQQLKRVKAVRLARGGTRFALRQLGLEGGSSLDVAQAKKMGEIIRVERALWGSFKRDGETWQVTVRAVNVVTGNVSPDLTVTAREWWDVRDGLIEKILKELALEPSEDEKRQMAKRWTNSAEILESLSKIYSAQEEEYFKELENRARSVVLAEPICRVAHSFLAAILASEGNLALAEEEARRALKIDPEDAASHRILGNIFLVAGRLSEGEKELGEAHRLDPDDPEALEALGLLSAKNQKLDEAIRFWEEAKRLDPLKAGPQALLAQAHARQGDIEKAKELLKEAERLNLGSANEEQQLFEANGVAGEVTWALEHYEKFAALIRKRGGNPAALKEYEQRAKSLTRRIPVALGAPPPKVYTRESLEAELRQKLSGDRLKLVKNSLESSLEVKTWALRVTQHASSDLEKAKAILWVLSHRPERLGKSPIRTALEAFEGWEKPDEAYRCQDYAKLYVAMAREAGLSSFYTIVEKNFEGRRHPHACGAVFLEGKAYLVDPVYGWFGVPHQEFQILDDLQTMASDLYQRGDSKDHLERCLAASELFPLCGLGQVNLVLALINESRLKEARQTLEFVSKLWTDRWDVFLVQGILDVREDKIGEALKSFQKSIDLNPREAQTHLCLAQLLHAKGRLVGALEEYQECLRHDPDSSVRLAAEPAILQLDEQLMAAASASESFDVIIRGGDLYDGNGAGPVRTDLGIRGDKIARVGELKKASAKLVIEAGGLAVTPGFINMLSWSTESLIQDGRSLGELREGVTTQIFGEGVSMGPLNDAMKKSWKSAQTLIRFDYEWTTLAEYLLWLQKRGITQNVASFVGATTVREYVLGHEDREPNAEELKTMRGLVRQAMEEGALGVGSSLIYAPAFYAKTDELVELCKVASEYGGMYISHIRSEGERLLEALDELIEISRRANIAAEIYHLKAAGKSNWPKLEQAIAKIEKARADGPRITADMYTYPAASTGLDACIPPWAHEGGSEAMWGRLKDPATRARIAREVREGGGDWENLYRAAGSPEGILIVECGQEENRKLQGKTLAEIAADWKRDPVEALMDLLVADRSRVDCVYFMMAEENLAKQIKLPWVSLCSDASSMAAEEPFLKVSTHPRAYGSFARLLGKYVREEKAIPLGEAIHRLSGLPAGNLRLRDRGLLKEGMFADVVVFDPATIADRATYREPHQYAVGVRHVLVNGEEVLKEGEPTQARPGRALWGPGRKQ